jgi:hypothetical protein
MYSSTVKEMSREKDALTQKADTEAEAMENTEEATFVRKKMEFSEMAPFK